MSQPTADAPHGVFARLHDERGSLVLALLVAMMGLTIGTVALASARMADRAVRRDRTYTVVLQAADAGVQHALSRLNTPGGSLTDQTTPVTVGDYSFSYDVTPVVASGGSAYEVRSTATAPDGEQRVVVATLQQETRFPYALFTDQAISFNGANLVDSYSSEALCAPLPACAWAAPHDGAGAVASNESLEYIGNAWSELAVIHDWASDPDDGRCTRSGQSPNPPPGQTTDPCEAPQLSVKDEPLDLTTPAELQFITDMETACTDADAWEEEYRASDGISLPDVLTPSAPLDYHCFDNVYFDEDVIVAPLGASLSVRPVVMVVRGEIVFGDNGAGPTVNCTGTCEQDSSIQFPRHLQIYTASPGTINVPPQTRFAGVLYAPLRTCQPGAGQGQGAANAEIFGAIICDSISQIGGWELHYDRALSGLGTGRFVVSSWREEVVS